MMAFIIRIGFCGLLIIIYSRIPPQKNPILIINALGFRRAWGLIGFRVYRA